MINRLLATVSGWAVALALAVTLFRGCSDLDRANDRIEQLDQTLLDQRIEIDNYERAMDTYKAITDSLAVAGGAVNRRVADRLGVLRDEFGL